MKTLLFTEFVVLGLLLPDPAVAQEFPPSGYMVDPNGTRCDYTKQVLNEFLIEWLYEGARIGANGRIEFDDQDCMDTTTSGDNLAVVLVTVSRHIWSWYAAQVGKDDPEDNIYAGLSGPSDNLCLQSASNNLGVSLHFIKTGGGRGLLAVNHALALDGCPNTVDPEGVMRELAKASFSSERVEQRPWRRRWPGRRDAMAAAITLLFRSHPTDCAARL